MYMHTLELVTRKALGMGHHTKGAALPRHT